MASVDDIDELIATRKLKGLDDGLYKESDKNVANMTEEAFNEIIDNFEVVAHLTMYGRKGIKENVKKLQVRIKELDVDLTTAYLKGYADAEEKYKKRIKELEEENKIFVQNGSNVKLEIYIKNNYIPKQK